jgi:enoyl-CoA hydratase
MIATTHSGDSVRQPRIAHRDQGKSQEDLKVQKHRAFFNLQHSCQELARLRMLRCSARRAAFGPAHALRCRSTVRPLFRSLSDCAAAFPCAPPLSLSLVFSVPCSAHHHAALSQPWPSLRPLGFSARRDQVAGLELVQVELEGSVATLTINRPKALNALSAAVVSELHSALDALETLVPDSTLRCLIVTGAGDRAFVAGADIAGMVGMSPEAASAYAATTHAAFRRLEHFPTPVLAAVNGFALGGGCELAQSCDVIYASEKAKFGQPEVKLGLMPGFAGTVRLPRKAGLGAAAEWTFTGEIYSAADAKEVGLVHKILPPEVMTLT